MTEWTCVYCDEPVLPSDKSTAVNVLDRGLALSARLAHWECSARGVLGSVGHQMGQCLCKGGTCADPPDLTKREAAKAAVEFAKQTQRAGRA